MGKLTGEQMRERLVEPPKPVQVERAVEAVARAEEHIAEQGNRPLAVTTYCQELAEGDDREDGRYLVDVLDALSFEVSALAFKRGATQRELAMCLTKIQEARHWAIADGVRHNSIVVLDRRIFKVDKED